MNVRLSKEAAAAIFTALHAAVCDAEGNVEVWAREDLKLDPEVQRTCLAYAEERLRERMGALSAFREAVSNGRG